ncbi:MAG: LysR family transcriptional regulator, partial [Shimia sp.]
SLVSSFTSQLRADFADGAFDAILTTEAELGRGGQTLTSVPLVWFGAVGGSAWQQRPLRLAFERNCIFRATAQRALDRAGIAWEMAVESNSSRTIEATVGADLAIHAMLAGTEPTFFERIPHDGALPAIGSELINLYVAPGRTTTPRDALAELLEEAYSAL